MLSFINMGHMYKSIKVAQFIQAKQILPEVSWVINKCLKT